MKNEKSINKKSVSISSALATSVLATALLSVSNVASAASTERCADIIKGGKNSCAVTSLGISCQGQATQDNMPGAWIKVPAGTCGNIISICGGSVDAPEGTKKKKLAKACDKLATQTDPEIIGGRLVDKKGESI